MREWGFVVAFVATLALGIGANGAVFAALNSYLFKPLPYPQAGQLDNVYAGSHVLPMPKGEISATFARFVAQSPMIASSGLYQGGVAGGSSTVNVNGEPRSVGSVNATAGLFKTLGVHPLLGRWLDSASNRPGGPSEVVVSYRFWQGALGGKDSVIGQP